MKTINRKGNPRVGSSDLVRCPLCDGARKITASIGGTILLLRTRKGLTQEQLAKAANLAKGYMSELERGNQDNPSLSTLMAISKVLGMSASKLVACHEKRTETSNAGTEPRRA